MTRKSTFKQSDITKALKAARDAGFNAQSFRITPEGSIDVTLTADVTPSKDEPNSWDTVFG